MTSTVPVRYGVNPYADFIKSEGIPVSEGRALDLFELPTGPWPRYGINAAAAHFNGSGDYCSMFVMEIAAGKSSNPVHHLYEEIYFVLEGSGSTEVTFSGGRRHSFEWEPRSFFAIPLNATHRHFNGSGTKRALLCSTTTLPLIMNVFHNAEFVFGDGFQFGDRIGKDEYYAGQGDMHLIRPGNNIWETNFVPDLAVLELTEWSDRGPGSTNVNFVLADGIMHAHVSEVAPATYKKAHRHFAGAHVLTLSGNGYSLLWNEGDTDYTRLDWKYGTVFPPGEMEFHQHFVTSDEASRYVATGFGGIRYPTTQAKREMWDADTNKKNQFSRSQKDGGHQIEYEDQDPRIHAIWLEEMRKAGVTPKLELPVR